MSNLRTRTPTLFAAAAGVLLALTLARTSAAAPTAATTQAAATPQPVLAGGEATSPASQGWKPGPVTVPLGHELTLAVPAEHAYLPPAQAAKLLAKMGSFHNDNLLGLVASQDDNADWFVTLRYEDEGYIKDDDKIDADEILTAIREGTEESNKERVEKGFKAMKVEGWTDPPKYDKSLHHLVWALMVSDEDGQTVNFNTRILGRRGYVAINLVTGPEHLAEYKPQAATLLAATQFAAGARHQDFDEKKGDKVAEYGLAGLVLGGAGLAAAKIVKIGLLAKFSKVIIALLIAGKKVVIVALIAAAAVAKKLFFGKKADPQPEVPPAS